jgi:TRAP transporter TAXI family solute receptor
MSGLEESLRFVLIAVAAFALQIDSASFALAMAKSKWGILTGPANQTYYFTASKLKNHLQKRAQLKVIATEGSQANLNNLWKTRGVQWALVQSDVFDDEIYDHCEDPSERAWIDRYKVGAVLFDEQVHIVTRRGSGIDTLKDLDGKKVAIGEPGSGTSFTATRLLDSVKFTKPVVRVSYGPLKAKEELLAERLDAFFFVYGKLPQLPKIVTGPPAKLLSVTDDPRVQKLKLVGIDTEHDIEGSKRRWIELIYNTVTLTKDDYPFLDANVKTLSTSAILIFDHKKLNCDDKEVVVRIVKENFITKGLPKDLQSRPGWEACSASRSCLRRNQ